MTTWDTQMDEQLTKLWADGLSCSAIAIEVGAQSKNAVIGRARRIGLPKRRSGWQGGPGTAPRVRTAAAAARASKVKPLVLFGGTQMKGPPVKAGPLPMPAGDAALFDDAVRSVGPLHIHDLSEDTSECRFPIGYDDRLGHGFCGCTTVAGTSWCEHHLHRVSAPVRVAGQRVPPGPAARLMWRDVQTLAAADEHLEPA